MGRRMLVVGMSSKCGISGETGRGRPPRSSSVQCRDPGRTSSKPAGPVISGNAPPTRHDRQRRRMRGRRATWPDGDVPPLRIEPAIEVVVEEGGEPQQRQPRAGRIGVGRVDGDALAHLQPERRLSPATSCRPGTFGYSQTVAFRQRDGLPIDLDVRGPPAGWGRSRPIRAVVDPATRSRSCSRCPAGPGTSGCSFGLKDLGQVDAHPYQDLVGVDRDVSVAEPQRRRVLRDRQSVEDLHASSAGSSPSVTSYRDQSPWSVPHGGIPSGSAPASRRSTPRVSAPGGSIPDRRRPPPAQSRRAHRRGTPPTSVIPSVLEQFGQISPERLLRAEHPGRDLRVRLLRRSRRYSRQALVVLGPDQDVGIVRQRDR